MEARSIATRVQGFDSILDTKIERAVRFFTRPSFEECVFSPFLSLSLLTISIAVRGSRAECSRNKSHLPTESRVRNRIPRSPFVPPRRAVYLERVQQRLFALDFFSPTSLPFGCGSVIAGGDADHIKRPSVPFEDEKLGVA